MNSDRDKLDREIDAALSRCAAGEPRVGLEERVLANLRAAPEADSARGRWRWPAMAAVALVMVVALFLEFKSVRHDTGTAVRRPSIATPRNVEGKVNTAGGSEPDSVRKSVPRKPGRLPVVVARAPRLAQFPSPQPLSKQEKILESYIAQYPEHAALIAQARTDALQRDRAEELIEGAGATQSSQQ